MADKGSRALPFETPHAEIRRLRAENARLRQLLIAHGIPIPPPGLEDRLAGVLPPAAARLPTPVLTTPVANKAREKKGESEGIRVGVAVSQGTSIGQRISLIRNLFHGREDVYARRWQSADGTRAGYMPASLKDWAAINRSRPEERKRVDQATRTLLPLTDAVIEGHLSGRETVGIYPLLQDETCQFLAVDFDKESWTDDACAFLSICQDLNVPAALERSRSGNGGHVWIFFDQALQASTARKLGSLLLTRTMEERHQLGLDSYDRLFPNQDTMPKGGFGNLIALPLQFGPSQAGNSVFIDANLQPYPDQWQFLASLMRLSAGAAEALVAEAQHSGTVIGVRISLTEDDTEHDPWTLPPSHKRREERPITDPLPERIQLVRANRVYVEKQGLPSAILNRLLRLAAFQNPEFYKAQALRLSTYAKPRVIACGDDMARHIALPRGSFTDAVALLGAHHVTVDILDERFAGIPIAVEFQGQLQPRQEVAAAQISSHDEGILSAPTAFGKTVVAAWMIAKRKVNTLVLVHRQQLLDQWRERLALFLGTPVRAIGQIGGGKTERTGHVDVAVMQSLYRKDEVKDFVAEYGQVIVDECHHVAAFSFEQIMKQVKAKYVLGLTATPTRKDGHHPIIYMQCGPLRYHMSAKSMLEGTLLAHVVIPRHTRFRQDSAHVDGSGGAIHHLYAALTHDDARNALIADDLVRAVDEGRCPLLLTQRTGHLEYFASRLREHVQHVFVMRGGMGKKQRQALSAALQAVPEGERRVVIATGSYIGEGFDDARLDTLFLALPVSWKGTLQQYVGRLHRAHENKRVVQVYDYIDSAVPMLARMYERRLRGYSAIGYEIAQPEVANGESQR